MCNPYVLGIDIGGTNTVFGMVDARGEVLASSSIKTKKHSDFNDYLNNLHSEVTRMLADNDAEDKILGIGIGAPGGLLLTYYFSICSAKLVAVNERYAPKCEIIRNMTMSRRFSNNPPCLLWGLDVAWAEKYGLSFTFSIRWYNVK